MTARLALFDCDGTMVDSQHNICAAMERTFAEHDLPAPDRHDVRRIVGLSLTQAMYKLLPETEEEKIAALVASYKGHFFAAREAGQVVEPLYEGLVELFDRLLADGWLLGVATGKSQRGLRHCLETHDITGRFVTLQTADMHPSKPHPAMIEAAMAEAGSGAASTVMIGDTSFDMAMGVNAGTRAIGVNWGYHPAEELLASGAEIVVTTMTELHDQLENGAENG